jgi:opacity protein-like surface antigen
MMGRTLAVAMTLALVPAWLGAQGLEMRVTATSANVYKTPSTGSLVIGSVPRGVIFEVTRELGSWVKVSWPDGQDGVGYVHVSMGSVARRSPAPDANRAPAIAPDRVPAASANRPPAAALTRPTEPVALQSTATSHVWRTSAGEEVQLLHDGAPSQRSNYIAPPTHIVGLGGRMGSSVMGYGATARAWSHDRLGVQLEVSRAVLTSDPLSSRMTAMQFAPSLLFTLSNHVSDSVWMRPYLGAGASVGRQTLSPIIPLGGASLSNNSVGFQTFGGTEMTFPSVPRFALSVDAGYRWSQIPFPGFDLGGPGVSVSGHWYMK